MAIIEKCKVHNQPITPLYFRPPVGYAGRTFKRAEHLSYCPGDSDGNGAHIIIDRGLSWAYRYHQFEYDVQELRAGNYVLKTPEANKGKET